MSPFCGKIKIKLSVRCDEEELLAELLFPIPKTGFVQIPKAFCKSQNPFYVQSKTSFCWSLNQFLKTGLCQSQNEFLPFPANSKTVFTDLKMAVCPTQNQFLLTSRLVFGWLDPNLQILHTPLPSWYDVAKSYSVRSRIIVFKSTILLKSKIIISVPYMSCIAAFHGDALHPFRML